MEKSNNFRLSKILLFAILTFIIACGTFFAFAEVNLPVNGTVYSDFAEVMKEGVRQHETSIDISSLNISSSDLPSYMQALTFREADIFGIEGGYSY